MLANDGEGGALPGLRLRQEHPHSRGAVESIRVKKRLNFGLGIQDYSLVEELVCTRVRVRIRVKGVDRLGLRV